MWLPSFVRGIARDASGNVFRGDIATPLRADVAIEGVFGAAALGAYGTCQAFTRTRSARSRARAKRQGCLVCDKCFVSGLNFSYLRPPSF